MFIFIRIYTSILLVFLKFFLLRFFFIDSILGFQSKLVIILKLMFLSFSLYWFFFGFLLFLLVLWIKWFLWLYYLRNNNDNFFDWFFIAFFYKSFAFFINFPGQFNYFDNNINNNFNCCYNDNENNVRIYFQLMFSSFCW